MAAPLVSVIIPAYNAAPFIAQAIASVRTQTHPNIEIIVVDDGSTDGTADVVRTLPATLIQQHRLGSGEARNTGMDRAAGAYLLFLDADDYFIDLQFLADALATAEARQADLVCAGWQEVSASGTPGKLQSPWEMMPQFETIAWLKWSPVYLPTTLIRRGAIPPIARFNPAYVLAQDTEWLLQLVAHGLTGAWLQRHVTAYRLHPNSSTYGKAAAQANYTVQAFTAFFRRPLPLEIHRHEHQVTGHKLMWASLHTLRHGDASASARFLRAYQQHQQITAAQAVGDLCAQTQISGAADLRARLHDVARAFWPRLPEDLIDFFCDVWWWYYARHRLGMAHLDAPVWREHLTGGLRRANARGDFSPARFSALLGRALTATAPHFALSEYRELNYLISLYSQPIDHLLADLGALNIAIPLRLRARALAQVRRKAILRQPVRMATTWAELTTENAIARIAKKRP